MTLRIMTTSFRHQLPKAVMFDLDNTLYAYPPAHQVGWQAVRNKLVNSLNVTAAQVESAYVQARTETKMRLGKTASSHSRLLYFQRLIELLGLKAQPLLALDLEQTYWRSFLSAASLFSAVRDFLDDLRVLGIPVGLVTDLTTQIQLRKLVHFGLDRDFDSIVTTEEAGHDKPHPLPFQLLHGKLGQPAGPLWMIGDDPVADVKGARSVLQAVTLQKLHSGSSLSLVPDERPDISFDDYEELREYLHKLAAEAEQEGTVTADVRALLRQAKPHKAAMPKREQA